MRNRAAITYSANKKQVVIDYHVARRFHGTAGTHQRVDTAIVVPTYRIRMTGCGQ